MIENDDSIIYGCSLTNFEAKDTHLAESPWGGGGGGMGGVVLPCRGGGGTAIYGLYRYVPLRRVWLSSSLL